MLTRIRIPRSNTLPTRRLAPMGFGDLDRFLDEVWRGFGFPLSRVAEPGAFAPRMDVSETEEAFRIDAELYSTTATSVRASASI